MSTAELQLSLIQKILSTVDEKILKSLEKTLAKNPQKIKRKIGINNPKHPFYDKLSPEEEKAVKESLSEYERGEFTTLRTKEDIRNFVKNLV